MSLLQKTRNIDASTHFCFDAVWIS